MRFREPSGPGWDEPRWCSEPDDDRAENCECDECADECIGECGCFDDEPDYEAMQRDYDDAMTDRFYPV